MSESSHWLSGSVHSCLHMSACIIFALCMQLVSHQTFLLYLFICGHLAFEKLFALLRPFFKILSLRFLFARPQRAKRSVVARQQI